MSTSAIKHGFTAVPRSLDKLIADRPIKVTPKPVRVEDIVLPESTLARTIRAYARENLPEQTYNHSMRVYYFGQY